MAVRPARQTAAVDAAPRTTTVPWTLLHLDVFALGDEVPDGSVDCIVTSPPYFRQRDYDHDGQLGHEGRSGDYVERLVAALARVRPKLRDDGTLWLNLGDKYVAGELEGIPWRVALALKDAGWRLRSDVIWHKSNAMPSAVRTRPTPDHEYLFLLSTGDAYHYDADAIREPHVTFSPSSRMKGGRGHFGRVDGTPERGKFGGRANLHKGRWDQAFHPLGRNRRTVWSLPLGKFRDAHFAVFPEALVEPCVLAGSRPGGVVLDPFMGSGTTGLVALRHGRRFVGLDINAEYVEMARRRLAGAAVPAAPAQSEA